MGLRLLVGNRFQVLFHSPPGVLFTFPSRYWFAIGGTECLAFGGCPPEFPQVFSCPAVLGESSVADALTLRVCHPLWSYFPVQFTSPAGFLLRSRITVHALL